MNEDSTLKEILDFSADYLKEKGVDDPKYSAEEIVSHCLGERRLDLFFKNLNSKINQDSFCFDSFVKKLFEYLKRRAGKEPLEYIFNSAAFYGCELYVSKDVLIPRAETEQLVEKALQVIENDKKDQVVIWDVCTGSGAIAIALYNSLKKRFSNFKVVATDISEKALSIAKQNAEKNRAFIEFRQGDLLTPFEGERADYIICNPPYISEKDYETLMPGVKDFEPKGALVAKEEGFEFYKKMLVDLPCFLTPGGKVFFEIGYDLGEGVKKIVNDTVWVSKKLYQDLSGNDRFFFLEIE